MRAVIQRVKHSEVTVDGQRVGAINQGYLVFLGVAKQDNADDVNYMVEKIAGLRIFEDDQGKMNLALAQVGGAVLLVSQFTLYGDTRQGRRPGFTAAAEPKMADKLYQQVGEGLRDKGLQVEMGVFQADMQVSLINDGPVTMLLDSNKIF